MQQRSAYVSAALLSMALVAGLNLYTTESVNSQTQKATRNAPGVTKTSYAPLTGGTYAIDPAHSSINFAVRHLLINDVRGRFDDYSGTILYNADDVSRSSVEFTAKVASIDTDIAKRDEHLRTADFFDVAKYPEMTFKSTRVERKGEDGFIAHGDFTLHGVTKQVALPFKLAGAVKDPWGGTRMGVEAATTINRQDYGVKWNQPMAEGGFVVADDVRIGLVLEAVKQEPKPVSTTTAPAANVESRER